MLAEIGDVDIFLHTQKEAVPAEDREAVAQVVETLSPQMYNQENVSRQEHSVRSCIFYLGS